MRKSKRAKACDISQAVKRRVWERDKGRCVICGGRVAMPNAHFIPRSQGGLGIEQNIVTLCTELSENQCHRRFDFGSAEERAAMGAAIEDYLRSQYGPSWNKKDLVYRKWQR